MAVFDITTPYSRVTSFAYDRLIAPAVVPLIGVIEDRWSAAFPGEARVLDVGCGGGQVAHALAERHPGYDLTGLDLSHDQVRRADRRTVHADRVRFVQGSALELPFADGSFDAVYSIASLKHWPDIARGAAECARVLRPGGLLCLVEVERGCAVDDAWRFVRSAPIGVMPLALPFTGAFMSIVAGRGWHVDEARALLPALPLEGGAVERLPREVSVVLTGRRR